MPNSYKSDPCRWTVVCTAHSRIHSSHDPDNVFYHLYQAPIVHSKVKSAPMNCRYAAHITSEKLPDMENHLISENSKCASRVSERENTITYENHQNMNIEPQLGINFELELENSVRAICVPEHENIFPAVCCGGLASLTSSKATAGVEIKNQQLYARKMECVEQYHRETLNLPCTNNESVTTSSVANITFTAMQRCSNQIPPPLQYVYSCTEHDNYIPVDRATNPLKVVPTTGAALKVVPITGATLKVVPTTRAAFIKVIPTTGGYI